MKRKVFIVLVLLFIICGCSKNETTTKKEKNVIEPTVTYGCDFGDELENDQCVKKNVLLATLTYECPIGYTTYGNQCWKTGGILNISKCGANHVELYGMCYSNILATIKYTCYTGELEGTNCVNKTYYSPETTYSCPDKYVLNANKKCEEK